MKIMQHRGISLGILIITVVIVIIYVIVLFECYVRRTWVFAPYDKPPGPEGSFNPVGEIEYLTQEAIKNRNEMIKEALK